MPRSPRDGALLTLQRDSRLSRSSSMQVQARGVGLRGAIAGPARLPRLEPRPDRAGARITGRTSGAGAESNRRRARLARPRGARLLIEPRGALRRSGPCRFRAQQRHSVSCRPASCESREGHASTDPSRAASKRPWATAPQTSAAVSSRRDLRLRPEIPAEIPVDGHAAKPEHTDQETARRESPYGSRRASPGDELELEAQRVVHRGRLGWRARGRDGDYEGRRCRQP